MLDATWRGTSAQRGALRSAGFSFRQSAIFFCQVMELNYMNRRIWESPFCHDRGLFGTAGRFFRP
jgi:hypothetical protein